MWGAARTACQLVLQAMSLAAFVKSSAEGAACFTGGGFNTQDWHCRELAPTIALYYKVREAEERLYMGVHVQDHDGWVGIGINGNGGMKGGSFVIVRMEDGKWIAEDRYALDYSMPTLDEQQDVALVDAQKRGADVMWIVSLPLNSCDLRDYHIKDILQRVLWAKGSSHSFAYHGNQVGVDRGSAEVNFHREPVQVTDPADAFTIDLRMPNVAVKAAKDGSSAAQAQVCAAFSLEQLGVAEGTFHITKFSAIVSPEASKYVQQVFVNPCVGGGTPRYVFHDDPSSWVDMDCEEMLACHSRESPHLAWAAGGGDVVFPNEAGYEVSTTRVKFFAMKVHYYDPAQAIDAIDNSGIRLTATRSLRPNKIGIMTLQASPAFDKPLEPGLERAWTFLQVPTPCLNDSLAAGVEELTLLNVYHHQHLRGTEIQVRVISSSGQDRGLVRTEKRYDFNQQRLAPSEVMKMDRTDKILMVCEFDTSNDVDLVRQGQNTQTNEMCISQLYYYPASETILYGMPARPLRPQDVDFNVTLCGSGAEGSYAFEFTPKEEKCSGFYNGSISALSTSTSMPPMPAPSSSAADSADRGRMSSSASWLTLLVAMMMGCLSMLC